MIRNKQIRKDVVVFSQWSRKNYAVFASLKKVVAIAHLSIDLCKSALLKTKSAIQFIRLIGFDEDEAVDSCGNETAENQMLIAATLPVVYTKIDIYHQVINNYAIKKAHILPRA